MNPRMNVCQHFYGATVVWCTLLALPEAAWLVLLAMPKEVKVVESLSSR